MRMKVPALMSTILGKGTKETGVAGRDEADCPSGRSELSGLQPSSEESAKKGMRTPQNRGMSWSSCEGLPGSPPIGALSFLVTMPDIIYICPHVAASLRQDCSQFGGSLFETKRRNAAAQAPCQSGGPR